MKRICLLKSVLDGIIQFIFLIGLSTFTTSEYTQFYSLKHFMLISILGAILLTVVYLVFMIKETNNRMIVWFSLSSFCSFCLCITILFVARLTFTIDNFYMRQINNADGILIIFTLACFFLTLVVLRLCVFVMLIIKNNILHKESSG